MSKGVKQYYLMAIEHGNVLAMLHLANYYKRIEKNEVLSNLYDSMRKNYT